MNAWKPTRLMGSRAAGEARVWRRWTLHHEDVAKQRWEQTCRNRSGCGQKVSSNQDPGRKSCSVPEVLNLQYHFHFGSLHFKQRSSRAGDFREKHKHNVRAWWRPVEMNSGGTIKQENEVFQPYNSEKGKRANVKGRAWFISVLHWALDTLCCLIFCQK